MTTVQRVNLYITPPMLHLFAHFWFQQELCRRHLQDGNGQSRHTELRNSSSETYKCLHGGSICFVQCTA